MSLDCIDIQNAKLEETGFDYSISAWIWDNASCFSVAPSGARKTIAIKCIIEAKRRV